MHGGCDDVSDDLDYVFNGEHDAIIRLEIGLLVPEILVNVSGTM